MSVPARAPRSEPRPATIPARPPQRSPLPASPEVAGRRAGAVRRKHHAGFLLLASIVIGSMVLGIVSLNALLAQTSFRIDETERGIEALAQEHLELVREQASLSAPGRIAAWARRNGMRLPDDIRSLHASGDATTAPAGAADDSGTPGDGA